MRPALALAAHRWRHTRHLRELGARIGRAGHHAVSRLLNTAGAWRGFRKWFLRAGAVCLAVMLLAVVALAQDSSGMDWTHLTGQPQVSAAAIEAQPSTAVATLMAVLGKIELAISNLRTRNPLAGMGRYIMGVLASIVITWTILKNWMLGKPLPQLVADLVMPFVVLGLGIAATENGFADIVDRSVKAIGKAMTGSDSLNAINFAQKMIANMGYLWKTLPSVSILDLSISSVIGVLAGMLALLILACATGLGLGVYYVSQFQVAFAIALAPAMIPWLIFRPTEFLFNGWLGFLLKGGFMVIALFAVESIIFPALAQYATMTQGWSNLADSMIAYGGLVALALLFAFLISKAAEIGAGVVGGATVGIGGLSFMAMAAAGATVAAAKTAGNVAGGTARAGASAGMGLAHKGKSDAEIGALGKALSPRRGMNAAIYNAARGDRPPAPSPKAGGGGGGSGGGGKGGGGGSGGRGKGGGGAGGSRPPAPTPPAGGTVASPPPSPPPSPPQP